MKFEMINKKIINETKKKTQHFTSIWRATKKVKLRFSLFMLRLNTKKI